MRHAIERITLKRSSQRLPRPNAWLHLKPRVQCHDSRHYSLEKETTHRRELSRQSGSKMTGKFTFHWRSTGNQKMIFVVDQIDITAHHSRPSITTNTTIDDSVVVRSFEQTNWVLILRIRKEFRKSVNELELFIQIPLMFTTPWRVTPKLGAGNVHELYARMAPFSGTHSITASLPMRLSSERPTATYAGLSRGEQESEREMRTNWSSDIWLLRWTYRFQPSIRNHNFLPAQRQWQPLHMISSPYNRPESRSMFSSHRSQYKLDQLEVAAMNRIRFVIFGDLQFGIATTNLWITIRIIVVARDARCEWSSRCWNAVRR